MFNESLYLLFNTLAIIDAVPNWIWGIITIVGIIITIILGYPYAKKLSNQTEKNIVEKLEHCINERMQVSSQGKEANSVCTEVIEDARRLQSASSIYNRGLSKATLGDLEGAKYEFTKAIQMQLPVLSESYFQRGNMKYLQKNFKDACIDYSEAIIVSNATFLR